MRSELFGDAPPAASRRAQIGWSAAALLAAAFSLWAALYFSGVWPWLGYASASRSSFGLGPFSVVGQTGFGGNLGLTRFLFVEGQEVVIDYDAEIGAGSLYFYVFQPFDGTLGDGASHYVSRSGAGTWTWRVPETGFYTVIIRPTVGGGDSGYDMSYSAWWGARPAH